MDMQKCHHSPIDQHALDAWLKNPHALNACS